MSITTPNVNPQTLWRNLWSRLAGSMESASTAKRHLAILALYLNQAEARDKICRAIQYGSKFVAGENCGVAHEVDMSTGLARKVFRLLKSVEELEALITPPPSYVPLPVLFLDKSKNLMMAFYFALDHLVWAGRVGIYKNKWHTELIWNVSLYFFLGGSACSSISEFLQLVRKSVKKDGGAATQEGGASTPVQDEKKQQQYAHALSCAKSSMDVVVAIGLLQLLPRTVTPRVTGFLGTITSLMACYELFKATSLKVKTS